MLYRSIRKQVVHLQNKENQKFIKELQQRMTKKEMLERNKKMMIKLNKLEEWYSIKYSVSKIENNVQKELKEKQKEL